MIRLSIHSLRRWLSASAALFVSTAVVSGQIALPPDINLFSDSTGLQLQRPAIGRGHTDKIAAPADAQTLVFTGGRQIHGELVRMTGEEIVWHRTDASEPLRFPRREVQRIVVTPVSPGNGSDAPEGSVVDRLRNPAGENNKPVLATLKLPGVDWLYGDVRSADGQTFTVRLEDGTPLTVPRPNLAWMHFSEVPTPVAGFAGAALDMNGWLPASATMEVNEGTLTVRGAEWLGRAIPAQTRFEIAFELPEGCEEGTSVWLHPSEPDLDCSQSGTVGIRICDGYIARMLFFRGFEQKNLPLPERAPGEHGPAQYRVFYDGPARRIILKRNGREVCDWTFIEPGLQANFQVGGISFHRDDHGKSEDLKFKRIQVRPWNGVDPEDGTLAGAQDQFSFVNATPPVPGQLESLITPGRGIPLDLAGAARFTGKLQSVTETELLVSDNARPRKTGMFVQFPREPAALLDAEARLQLGTQGELSAKNLEVHDGRLRCVTAFAPALELPISALRSIALPRQSMQEAGLPAEGDDLLVFKNGDELGGTAISARAHGPVRWKLASGQELAFDVTRLAGLRLAGAGESAAFHPAATVETRNGDQLRGQLLDLDENQLRLRHSELGTLTVNRSRLWHIYPNPELEVLDGGADPDEWMRERRAARPSTRRITRRSAPGKWMHLDGIYFLGGGARTPSFDLDDGPALQREIGPALERFEVRLEAVASDPDASGFFLQLLSERRGPSLRAVVSAQALQLNISKSLDLTQAAWHNYLVEEKLGVSPSRLGLRLFVDCNAGTCDLYLNGVFMAHLGRRPDERMTKSAYLVRFQPCQSNAMVTALSHLWIGPWGGELLPHGGPCIALANGDAARAAPKEMRDGKFLVESESGPVELPMGKVTSVDFGGAMMTESAAGRLRLADGTKIDVEDFLLQDGELTAHSASLGNLRLSAKTARELIFNPSPARAPMTPEPKDLAQKAPLEKDPNLPIAK